MGLFFADGLHHVSQIGLSMLLDAAQLLLRQILSVAFSAYLSEYLCVHLYARTWVASLHHASHLVVVGLVGELLGPMVYLPFHLLT